MKNGRIILIALSAALVAAPGAFGANIDAARDLVNKGNFLMASNKFNEALKAYEDAEKLEPSNTVIKANIGKLYNNWAIWFERQKKYREAQEKLEKCLEVTPGYGQARSNLVLLKRLAASDGVDLDAPAGADEAVPSFMKNAAGAEAPKNGVQAAKIAPTVPTAGAVLILGGQPQAVEPSRVDSYPISATSDPTGGASQKGTAYGAQALAGPVPFDEQIGAIEMKVYGTKQTTLTVLQRLEKIERESTGQVRTGSIIDRINYLKGSFGL